MVWYADCLAFFLRTINTSLTVQLLDMSYGIERRKALKSEIPTLRRVLKYYANRLTDLRDDPELRYENNFIRNDLFLADVIL